MGRAGIDGPAVALAPERQSALEDILARVRELAPTISAQAAEVEAQGRVSAEMMDALRQTGALDLTKPARFGGLEYGPQALIQLGYEIGRSCGSTAWCASLTNANAWFTSFWPVQAQADVWGEDALAVVAGVAAVGGRAERAQGGYRVEGRFPFASNCDNSQWVFVAAIIPEDDAGPARSAWFLLPRSDLSIDHASWEVSGMRGTGSKAVFTTAPVFVPDHRTILFEDIAAGTPPGASAPDNILARFSYTTFGAAALVGPIMGMARGALDWFADYVQSKVRGLIRPGAPSTPATSAFVQAKIGAASAMIDGAMALLLADLAQAEAEIRQGRALDIAARVRVRRNFGFAARQAVDAVNLISGSAGGSAANLGIPFQRLWRDINSAARHVSLDTEALYALAGQQRVNLPLVGTY